MATRRSFLTAACGAGVLHAVQRDEPYVIPSVLKPFPDGIRLEIPKEIAGQSKAAWGILDITEAPFGADPTGRSDTTQALRRAIEFARDHQMICFFPAGTYRISDTLSCIALRYRRANGRVLAGGRLFPCLLMGSRAGKSRPRIVLAPRSVGYGDASKPKHVIYFWARGYQVSDGSGPPDALSAEVEQPNISFNQMFVNLDIEIGEGNPGAIAIRHQGAEGSAIEDCRIDATHGFVGIQGGIGSGGGSTGVTVVGGRIGLDFTGYFSGTQPTPTVTGFTLLGQSGCAIRSSSRQTLVAAGLKIVAGKSSGPPIDCMPAKTANLGQLSLVDSEIDFPSGASGDRVAIASASSVYLNNVFVRNASQVVVNPESGRSIPGKAGEWLHIRECAVEGSPRQNQGLEYRYPIYIDGRPHEGPLTDIAGHSAPPSDLQARHVWSAAFPTWESSGAVNVRLRPYEAKGDGDADDTEALQRAINEHEVVFLPKGYYRISKTLELRPNTKLVGVGQSFSIITAVKAEGEFADPKHPAPLVRTADTADADTVLAFCGLYPGGNSTAAYALHWRCGGRSIFRACEIWENSISKSVLTKLKQSPLVIISGHGGGRWYNFRAESAWGHGDDYRHLLVKDNTGPLHFYQFSPQHAVSTCATEFVRARDVSIFGAKYEGNRPMVWVHDSDRFRLFGHGGNAKAVENGALILIERTPNLLLANAVDGPTKINTGGKAGDSGHSTDPRKWWMIIDRPKPGEEQKPRPLERPVLWKRGKPGPPD